ncbi:TPA: LPS O-antigen length regulator [Vibrio harveyi]|nr:LPS O-antigen length regulator [Vibrio harveyi]
MEPQKELHPNYLLYPSKSQNYEEKVDLRKLVNVLWKSKWIVVATTALFSIGAVFYALSLSDIYKADALLAPAESSNGGGLSKMAGQLGGLAALAGVNLGDNEASQADLAVRVMKSRQFIESFIDKHDLMVPLMAAKDWDLSSNKLILDEEIYNQKSNEWLRNAEGLRGSKPSSQEMYEIFNKEVLGIIKDKESGLYTVSVKYYSPYIAQQWVQWLVEDINQVMRERAISETSQNLAYLNMQLKKTSVTDMQDTFYKLIEEQTKSLMLAEVQEEFIFKTVDPAVVPELKSEPKRALICLLGALIGGLFGTVIVLIRFVFQQSDYSND